MMFIISLIQHADKGPAHVQFLIPAPLPVKLLLPVSMFKAKLHPPKLIDKRPATRPVLLIKHTHTYTHRKPTVTNIEVEGDEDPSLSDGVVLLT